MSEEEAIIWQLLGHPDAHARECPAVGDLRLRLWKRLKKVKP